MCNKSLKITYIKYKKWRYFVLFLNIFGKYFSVYFIFLIFYLHICFIFFLLRLAWIRFSDDRCSNLLWLRFCMVFFLFTWIFSLFRFCFIVSIPLEILRHIFCIFWCVCVFFLRLSREGARFSNEWKKKLGFIVAVCMSRILVMFCH